MEINVLLTYGFLFLSVISIWVQNPVYKHIQYWQLFLFFSTVCALYFRFVTVTGIAALLVFGFLTYLLYVRRNIVPRLLLSILILILGALLFTHKIPGFHNYQVLSNYYVSKDGIPFNLYFNLDKVAAGIFIIGFSGSLVNKLEDICEVCRKLLVIGIVTYSVMLLLSFLLGYIHVDIKLPAITALWLLTNLLFVCMAEEAFFRRFIQGRLSILIPGKHRKIWAIIISSVLFGLAHFPGGVKYMCLACVAGLFYGYIYCKTSKIESSILLHFSLNTIHFFFFTYPALKSGFE